MNKELLSYEISNFETEMGVACYVTWRVFVEIVTIFHLFDSIDLSEG